MSDGIDIVTTDVDESVAWVMESVFLHRPRRDERGRHR